MPKPLLLAVLAVLLLGAGAAAFIWLETREVEPRAAAALPAAGDPWARPPVPAWTPPTAPTGFDPPVAQLPPGVPTAGSLPEMQGPGAAPMPEDPEERAERMYSGRKERLNAAREAMDQRAQAHARAEGRSPPTAQPQRPPPPPPPKGQKRTNGPRGTLWNENQQ